MPRLVCYPEGSDPAQAKVVFIGHGSSLRRGGDVRFASLAKLNVIAKEDGGKLDLQAAGQPRMKFSYKSQAPKVTINGQPAKAVRADKLLKIKN